MVGSRSCRQGARSDTTITVPATGKTTGARPSYVVDHIVPLKRGDADQPENMQGQTTGDAKAKGQIE